MGCVPVDADRVGDGAFKRLVRGQQTDRNAFSLARERNGPASRR